MSTFRATLIILCLYISGFALYSSLFVLSTNQFALFQIAKAFIASLYSLVFIIPILLAQQSRWLILRVIGYVILIAYFIYAFFLIGYFSYFGFVPEIYALGLASAADMTRVSGHYFQQIFGITEVVLIVSMVTLFYLLPRQKLPKKSIFLLVMPVILFGVALDNFGAPSRSAVFGNASVIRRFGLPTFYYLSAQEWLSLSSGYLAEQTPFPGKLSRAVYTDANAIEQPTANVTDTIKRVFLVQIESLDREAIDAELNGISVMPFVSNLKASSCREYTNFHTIKSLGGSSDAEFSVATGRLPSSKHQSIRYADFTQIDTIYNVLAEHGIASHFAHNNNIGFYGRNYAYSQLSNLDYTFLRPNETVDEQQFALDSFANALNTSDKLFYYFFNFQSHGPYKGYTSETKEKFRILSNPDIKSNYMMSIHEVDETISKMFALQQSGFDAGENLFILTADHPSYLHTSGEKLSQTNIPMLLCHNSFSGQQVDKVASTVDLFPTILDVFKIPSEDLAIGESLLNDMPSVVLFPAGIILYRQEDGTLETIHCGDLCRGYFNYTDQFIHVSN